MPSDKKRVYIGFCLDKSKSMERIWSATIKGVNAQIKSICEDAGSNGIETLVSLTVFDHNVTPVYFGKSVNYLSEIAEETYQPLGGTALYDAIGAMTHSMTEISEEADPANSYLLFVFSDGDDRNSKKFTRKACGDLIKEKTDTKKWTYTFTGCDQNLLDVSKYLNIPQGNIASFSKSGGGMMFAAARNIDRTKSYMKGKLAGLESTASFHGAETIADYTVDEKLPENLKNVKTFNNVKPPVSESKGK